MQDIDAAYLFQDIGDIDDDLSSLLVPDLDFSGINDIYPAAVKKPAPVQTGKSSCTLFPVSSSAVAEAVACSRQFMSLQGLQRLAQSLVNTH